MSDREPGKGSDEIERIRADLERTGGRPVVSEAIRFATQDMPILLEALATAEAEVKRLRELLLGRAGGAVGVLRRLAEPDPAKRYSREGLEAEARNYLTWHADELAALQEKE